MRMPPRIKALEAASAVAAGRVERLGDGCFRVVSSDGSRVYRVYVDPRAGVAYSDDNGTRLRGYIGYPIIAALMALGVVPYDEAVGETLRGVPWRRWNEELRKYSLVLERVYRVAEEKGVPRRRLEEYIERVLAALRGLRLRRLGQPPLECMEAGGVGEAGRGGAGRAQD